MSIFSQVFDRQIFYEQAFYPKVFYEKLLTEEIRECVHDTRKCKSYLELYDHYKTKTAALVSPVHPDHEIEANDHRLEGSGRIFA